MIPGLLLLLAVVVFAPLGLIFLTLGIRGAPALSEPRCAKCRYDLRTFGDPHRSCPECGSDLMIAKAVRFGSYRWRPKLTMAGAALLLLPVLLVPLVGLLAARVSVPGPAGRAAQSNATLITALGTTAGQPWDWQELEQRYRTGRLTNAEAMQAVEALITWIKANHPGGLNQPLHWSNDFLELVDKGGAIDAAQYARLADAFYGQPTVSISGGGEQDGRIAFEVKHGTGWDLPGVDRAMAVRAVRLADGTAVRAYANEDRNNVEQKGAEPNRDLLSASHSDLRGNVVLDLPPGPQELTFVVDVGLLVANSRPQVIHDKPGQAEHWPTGRSRKTYDVKATVNVVGKGQPIIPTTTEKAIDPTASLSAKEGMVTKTAKGVSVKVTIESGGLPVAISFDVLARIDGQEHTLGRIVKNTTRGSGSSGASGNLPALPPAVTAIDVILRPNPAHTADYPGIDRIWGGEIVLRDVPVHRYDLETGKAPAME